MTGIPIARPISEAWPSKMGTIGCEARDDYMTTSLCMSNLKEGQVFPFQRASTSQIPMTWQSNARQRKMEPYLTRKGFRMTGIR
jgi:hypothetical protein